MPDLGKLFAQAIGGYSGYPLEGRSRMPNIWAQFEQPEGYPLEGRTRMDNVIYGEGADPPPDEISAMRPSPAPPNPSSNLDYVPRDWWQGGGPPQPPKHQSLPPLPPGMFPPGKTPISRDALNRMIEEMMRSHEDAAPEMPSKGTLI